MTVPVNRRRMAELRSRAAQSAAWRLLTTAEAAAAVGVPAATIRKWKQRGLLIPSAFQGRRPLYVERDVLQAEHAQRTGRGSRSIGGDTATSGRTAGPDAVGVRDAESEAGLAAETKPEEKPDGEPKGGWKAEAVEGGPEPERPDVDSPGAGGPGEAGGEGATGPG
ncbi:MerR family transcriptional regulator [Streptomyces sp. NPDC001941]|uniref:MerR family transcriptional regulator n=1 Tax=Streptomyces sp. NPDC001941 TaxID=3154659 RepID=UPI0033313C59